MGETGAFRWQWLDFNGDRRISVEDASGWFWHLLFLPGDVAIDLLLAVPPIASLLDLGPASYGGVGSKTISVMFWLAVLIVCGLIINAVRDFDRALTVYVTRQWAELGRNLRILRRRLVSTINMRRKQREERSTGIDVAEMQLAKAEAAVLRCYADLGDARTLSAPDVSAVTKCSLRETQSVLLRLVSYRLLQPAFGTDDGHPAYQITQTGQIYLIEH
jgi:hypothetical protein